MTLDSSLEIKETNKIETEVEISDLFSIVKELLNQNPEKFWAYFRDDPEAQSSSLTVLTLLCVENSSVLLQATFERRPDEEIERITLIKGSTVLYRAEKSTGEKWNEIYQRLRQTAEKRSDKAGEELRKVMNLMVRGDEGVISWNDNFSENKIRLPQAFKIIKSANDLKLPLERRDAYINYSQFSDVLERKKEATPKLK